MRGKEEHLLWDPIERPELSSKIFTKCPKNDFHTHMNNCAIFQLWLLLKVPNSKCYLERARVFVSFTPQKVYNKRLDVNIKFILIETPSTIGHTHRAKQNSLYLLRFKNYAPSIPHNQLKKKKKRATYSFFEGRHGRISSAHKVFCFYMELIVRKPLHLTKHCFELAADFENTLHMMTNHVTIDVWGGMQN